MLLSQDRSRKVLFHCFMSKHMGELTGMGAGAGTSEGAGAMAGTMYGAGEGAVEGQCGLKKEHCCTAPQQMPLGASKTSHGSHLRVVIVSLLLR